MMISRISASDLHVMVLMLPSQDGVVINRKEEQWQEKRARGTASVEQGIKEKINFWRTGSSSNLGMREQCCRVQRLLVH